MTVIKKTRFEDKIIDRKVYRYGVNRLARDLNVSAGYISRALNGSPIGEDTYLRIKTKLSNVKNV